MAPRSGSCRPLMTLNKVVFPAPLGPMRPVTVPGGTTRLTSVRADTPPKLTLTWDTVNAGRPPPFGSLANLGSSTGDTGLTAHRRDPDAGQRPAVATARGSLDPWERQQRGQAIDPENAAGRPAYEDDPGPGHQPQTRRPERGQHHKGHCGQKCPTHRPDTPDGDEQDKDDPREEIEVGGADGAVDGGVEAAGDTGQGGSNGKHRHLGDGQVDTHR